MPQAWMVRYNFSSVGPHAISWSKQRLTPASLAFVMACIPAAAHSRFSLRARLVDEAQELALVGVDELQQLRVLLAQLLQHRLHDSTTTVGSRERGCRQEQLEHREPPQAGTPAGPGGGSSRPRQA